MSEWYSGLEKFRSFKLFESYCKKNEVNLNNQMESIIAIEKFSNEFNIINIDFSKIKNNISAGENEIDGLYTSLNTALDEIENNNKK